MKIVMIAFLLVNIIAFILAAYDKRTAKIKKTRISENKLLAISLIGGTFGLLFAMLFIKHKTSKISFITKFIFIILIQVIIVFWIVKQFYPIHFFKN